MLFPLPNQQLWNEHRGWAGGLKPDRRSADDRGNRHPLRGESLGFLGLQGCGDVAQVLVG